MEPTENVELEMVEIHHHLENLEALERLEKNPDFQKLIMEGYLKQKVLDSMSMLAHPSVKKRGERPDIMEDLVASSNLNYYFFMIKQLGLASKADMQDLTGPNVEE